MSIGSEEIGLWLENPKYEALVRALEGRGENVRAVMQAKLDELYEQTVPVQERIEIDDLIDADRLADAQAAEATRRFSVYRVNEGRRSDFFETEKAMDFPRTASLLRRYQRGELPAGECFADAFHQFVRLNFDSFDCRITEYMDGRQQISGVFEIDLNRQTVSVLDREQGWQEYNLKDVSTAIYHAQRKDHRRESEVQRIFYERLEGKMLNQAPTQDAGPALEL